MEVNPRVAFYADVHIRRAVTTQLRLRGIDVLTAQEDGRSRLDDAELLKRAASLGRVLISQDDDLLREAHRCQKDGSHFSGLVYSHQQRITIGGLVEDLTLIAEASAPEDWIDRIEFLPLR